MKNGQYLFFSGLATLFLIPMLGQSSKTFIRTFDLSNVQTIEVQLDGDISVEYWDEPTARILMEVTINHESEHMLTALARKGRYTLIGKNNTETLSVQAPGLAKQISIGGKVIEEQIKYVFFLPREIALINPEGKVLEEESTDEHVVGM